jgi:hypothetical protein
MLGGMGRGNGGFPLEEVIRRIEGRIEGFFVRVGANEADVFVVSPIGGRKYIRTNPDLTKVDNLLSLPNCLKM